MYSILRYWIVTKSIRTTSIKLKTENCKPKTANRKPYTFLTLLQTKKNPTHDITSSPAVI